MHLVGAEGGRLLQLERCGWLRLDRSGRRIDRSGGMRATLSCEGKKRKDFVTKTSTVVSQKSAHGRSTLQVY